jgi:hypothetical protein
MIPDAKIRYILAIIFIVIAYSDLSRLSYLRSFQTSTSSQEELRNDHTDDLKSRIYKYVTVLQIGFRFSHQKIFLHLYMSSFVIFHIYNYSCISLLIVCLALPLMYSNIQTTIDYVDNELLFCEQFNREFAHKISDDLPLNRTARQTDDGYGGGIVQSATGIPIQSECPGCCIPGPPGLVNFLLEI